MTYEELQKEAAQQGIDIYEMPFSPRIKGLYSNNTIAINKLIPTIIEKVCVLSEELGHHHKTSGTSWTKQRSKTDSKRIEREAGPTKSLYRSNR